MNNQIPYGFIPPFNNQTNRNIEERLDKIEKQIKKVDKRLTMLENNINYPMPYSNQRDFPNNYII